jgi:nucleoside-diphosphate-sugar epimerase
MPRILIAGCGYVGRVTAGIFHAAGWKVEAWTRSAESAQGLLDLPFAIQSVDIGSFDQVRNAAAEFDWVVHCASSRGGDAEQYRWVYLQGAKNLLRAFPRARLLFTSSTSVYSQADGSWIDESASADPVRETGRILRETEDLVLGARGIVVRAAGIYGPGRSFLLERFLAGNAIIDPKHDRFINQIHRDDVASVIFFLIQQGCAGIFNVVDDQPILRSECYEWLAQELQCLAPRPGSALSSPKRGDSNKRVSNKKLKALGWTPRYPTFAEGMRKSILPSQNLPKSGFWKLY